MAPLIFAALLHAAPACSSSGQCRPRTPAPHVQANGGTGTPDPVSRGHWLVDEENDEVLLVQPDSRVRRFAVPAWPEQLLALRDGSVIVTCREAGKLAVISRAGELRTIAAGAEPRALAADETTRRLYVGLVTGHELLAFNLDTFEPLARAALPFEPTALALLDDTVTAGSNKSAELLVFDAATLGERWRAKVPTRGGHAVKVEALLVSAGELQVAVTDTDTGMANVPIAGETGGYGGPRVQQPFNVAIFTLDPRGDYAVPVEVGPTALHQLTAAASAGVHTVLASRGERSATGVRLSERTWAPEVVAISLDELGGSALLDARRRVAIVSDRAEATARPVELPPSRLDGELRLGRELFHAVGDQRLSARAMGCVSCHPDGREDGLVWSLHGTARQTPMLAGGRLADTAPYNWLGTAPTLEDNVKQTVGQRLMGTGLTETELRALTRYVREGLRPVRVPPPPDPAAVARGRELFASRQLGCASCHPADLSFTDGAMHDVQSLRASEQAHLPRVLPRPGGARVPNPELQTEYDTPSLVGLSVTAPYFHDGAAKTLHEVIEHNGDRMGVTSHLDAKDRAALAAYLSTL